MVTTTELEELLVPDAAALRAWLEENHATSPGAWLVLHKKGGSVTTVTWSQAVDELLCFGWIDGQARARDDASSLQRITPRRPRSPWSARNVANVERLEAEGRMHDAGRAQVRAAQADGRWDLAYSGAPEAPLPEDLAAALAADPRAQAWFGVLTSTNRVAVVHAVASARRADTRARRIATFVADLAEGRTPFPQKRRPDHLPDPSTPTVDPRG